MNESAQQPAGSRRKLPLGIQNFQKIREGGYYYVDKTPFAVQMAEAGQYYFLSRPRRFGKSLFIDTLAEMFAGNRKLFDGLHAADHWDWSVKHPVIRISFGRGSLRGRENLDNHIAEQLRLAEASLGLDDMGGADNQIRFARIIETAVEKHGQRAVVLVDEYDKPILDNIEDAAAATEMREGLKNFYSVIKEADAHLRFAMLTGVSKFSKVSLFSGLNNLRDITLSPEYSALCGYTEADLDAVFAPELEGIDREELRTWYNGYNWLGEAVYNPYDALMFFTEKRFAPFWYETGNPSFLLKLLRQKQEFLPDLSGRVASAALLSTFDVDKIPTDALMFQAGYLTIDEEIHEGDNYFYRLRYPNLEVFKSLNENLLLDWTPSQADFYEPQSRLLPMLRQGDMAGIERIMRAFFASIPFDWHTNNEIAHYEGYYASVFYAFFASLGLDIHVEESSCAGRLDMAVKYAGHVIVFEFKVVEDEATPGGKSALAQILEKGYANKYRSGTDTVHTVGIEFSKAKRVIVAWGVGNY
jgi:hypothetical protein